MNGTYNVQMGDRGRFVVPAEVRDRRHLDAGTVLTLIETDDGLVLLTRDQLKRRVRADLGGLDLVGDLLVERRQAALDEQPA
ncbi:MAG: AbrB family looped-hinge helix DNA binding protein [Glaciecola sp.]|jgi:AbrB family looped-hinge helix DNA binding protein